MMKYKNLEHLCLKEFEQTKCIVLGNGTSVKKFSPHPDIFTIGVNDICVFHSPNVLLLIDTLARFARKGIEGRIEAIKNGTPDYYVIKDYSWGFTEDKTFSISFGKFAKRPNLDNKNIIDIGLDSPYVGAQLAYKMGFKKIAILGVDYTPHHFHRKDGEHELVEFNKIGTLNELYGGLVEDLKTRGVEFYNLNSESKIKSVPYMNYDKFIAL